jgi:4-hydroxy-tetrahydrodipicolinate synthase
MFQGSITALVTPFDERGENIDYISFRKLLQKQIEAKTDAIVIAGTTGEGSSIEKEELKKLLEFSLEEVDGKIPIIAATGTNITKKTLELTELAKSVGADAALIIVPYYNKPEDKGVIQHYKEIDKVKLPYILYHHPGRCGKELREETLIEIAKFDYLSGFKECSSNINLMKRIIEKSNGKPVLSGDDDKILERLELGMKGSISVVANIFPDVWKNILDLYISGNKLEAQFLYQKIKPMIWSLFIETNPQGVKYALSLKNLIHNTFRLPLLSVSEDTKEEITEAFYRSLEELGAKVI